MCGAERATVVHPSGIKRASNPHAQDTHKGNHKGGITKEEAKTNKRCSTRALLLQDQLNWGKFGGTEGKTAAAKASLTGDTHTNEWHHN